MDKQAYKANINHLKMALPRQYGYARKIADRLNEQKKRTVRDNEYSPQIVYLVLDQGHNDPNIEPQLVKLVEEYTGKPISVAVPKYHPTLTSVLHQRI